MRLMEGTRGEKLNESLCEVGERIEHLKGWQMKSYMSYSLGVVFQRVVRVDKSISLFKVCKRLSKAHSNYPLLIASYQGLGQCF